jgi:hypothetical protein
MFGDVEILVDLQTGAISVVIPGPDAGQTIELESVTADEPFAPRE